MTGLLGLARRQALAHRAVPVALALLVLLVAGVVTAWPRMLAGVDDRQTTHEIAGASSLTRDVIGVLPSRWPFFEAPEPGSTPFEPDVEANVGGILVALEDLRAEQPQPLRAMLGDPRFWVMTSRFQLAVPEGAAIGAQSVSLKVEPQLQDNVTLVDGRWPDAPVVVDPLAGLTRAELGELMAQDYAELEAAAVAATGPVEIALAAPTAEILEWEIGIERRVAGEPWPLVLTGTFEADDLDSGYWVHNPYSAEPEIIDDLNLGTSGYAAAYLNPTWRGALPAESTSAASTITFTTQLWYPIDVAALPAAEVSDAAAQLTRFTAPQPLGTAAPPPEEATGPVPAPGTDLEVEVRFASGLDGVLERIQQQQAVTSTVLAIVAAGPLGVTLAVFLLGSRLLVSGRRSALALLSARGGSGGQLRAMLALEGLVIGVPPAALGAALAIALLPGRTSAADLVLTGLVALVPAVMLAASTSPRSLREARSDLGARRSRWRWIAEVVVLAATAVAVVLLGQRGVQPGTGETDLLLTAVPLLLAVATCVVVLRLYPLPVRALAGVLRRRRGVVAFLGSARSVRDTAGGLVPAVALVIAVSVSVFSAVLSSTVASGIQTTSWQAVGADLRLSGPVFDDAHTATIEEVDGVAQVAAVWDAGTVSVSGERIDLIALDPDSFRDVQDGGVGISPLPQELAGAAGTAGAGSADSGDLAADGPLPAVLAATTAAELAVRPGDEVQVAAGGGIPLELVATTDSLAGVNTGAGFVVVDAATFAEASDRLALPRLLLVDVTDGADPSEVLDRIREVEPVAKAENPAADAGNFLASPMAGGMNTALSVAVLLSVVLVLVAVVMTLMMGAPARARLLAILRTLGLGPRQARGVVAWELAPLAVVAILAGAGLGVLVPWVVLSAMDLRALTGGAEQPGLVLDPLVIGGVLGGVALVTALAVLVSTAISRHADLATELRMGEER